MTRAEMMKAKYGEDYYIKLAKRVKNRKGFHTNGNAKKAQVLSVKSRLKSN